MQRWKINLYILMVGNFLVMAGMTMIMPFLSLYLQHDLGLTGEHEIGVWAGIIFAANFVTSFLFQPLWGKLAEKYGRKMMLLRSGFGMSIVMLLMGFATAPWHLLLLRMLNGVISGFMPAAVSLVSSTTPKERMGFAMGTLQSGGTAGAILGPFIGGLMADNFGFRPIFYITGTLLFLASVISWLLVHEKFDRAAAAKKEQVSVLKGFRELMVIRQLPVLLTVTFLIQFAMLSPMPLIPLYVQHLHGTSENLAFYAGFVGSVTGISNMICSPVLGRLSDRIGATRILLFCLAGSAVMTIPQAFADSVGMLLVFRFLLGCFMGGLIPTVNALVRQYTPDGKESRAFGFNTSALSLGNMMGPVVGGALSGWIGIEGLFILAGVLLFLTCIWATRALRARQQASA
ncbi:MFS transporter [Cohnella sp. CIP 111063]|uniref:MFS transporter n=1 Tax=unclassified Cohnella TaxID=2636738 RepID=UPI000B8C674C|nr:MULTISPECIES: MFS transporter [unclassified Cohnella]OXS62626.1 MFS transporter [Cohnella sp. CIP 111063]PRX74885.1 putative MFS family arabinose efflux permease [Cohnella sp. SGD-V74]